MHRTKRQCLEYCFFSITRTMQVCVAHVHRHAVLVLVRHQPPQPRAPPPNPRPRHAANKVALPHWRPKHRPISSHVRPVLGRLSRQLLFLQFFCSLSSRLIQNIFDKSARSSIPGSISGFLALGHKEDLALASQPAGSAFVHPAPTDTLCCRPSAFHDVKDWLQSSLKRKDQGALTVGTLRLCTTRDRFGRRGWASHES